MLERHKYIKINNTTLVWVKTGEKNRKHQFESLSYGDARKKYSYANRKVLLKVDKFYETGVVNEDTIVQPAQENIIKDFAYDNDYTKSKYCVSGSLFQKTTGNWYVVPKSSNGKFIKVSKEEMVNDSSKIYLRLPSNYVNNANNTNKISIYNIDTKEIVYASQSPNHAEKNEFFTNEGVSCLLLDRLKMKFLSENEYLKRPFKNETVFKKEKEFKQENNNSNNLPVLGDPNLVKKEDKCEINFSYKKRKFKQESEFEQENENPRKKRRIEKKDLDNKAEIKDESKKPIKNTIQILGQFNNNNNNNAMKNEPILSHQFSQSSINQHYIPNIPMMNNYFHSNNNINTQPPMFFHTDYNNMYERNTNRFIFNIYPHSPTMIIPNNLNNNTISIPNNVQKNNREQQQYDARLLDCPHTIFNNIPTFDIQNNNIIDEDENEDIDLLQHSNINNNNNG